jgi:hypothetical protein
LRFPLQTHRVRALAETEIPVVVRADLYAVAALAGAAVVVIANVLNLSPSVAALVGITLCLGVRVLAISYGWQLPVARVEERSSSDADSVAVQSPEDGVSKVGTYTSRRIRIA